MSTPETTGATGATAEARARNQICARCGAVFGCGAKARQDHCWCMELPVLSAPLDVDGCLCPACLRQALEAQAQAQQ